jgi:hypothetical protein
MDGGKSDDITPLIDAQEQCIWRCVFNHKCVPFVRGEHWFTGKLSEVCPPMTNGSIEHCTNLLSIAGNGVSNRSHMLRTITGVLAVGQWYPFVPWQIRKDEMGRRYTSRPWLIPLKQGIGPNGKINPKSL